MRTVFILFTSILVVSLGLSNTGDSEIETLQQQFDELSKIESIENATRFVDTLIEKYGREKPASIDLDAVLTNLYLRRYALAKVSGIDGNDYFNRALEAHMRRASIFDNITEDRELEKAELKRSVILIHEATKDEYWIRHRDTFIANLNDHDQKNQKPN